MTNPREEIVCPQSLNSGPMEKVIQVCTMIANKRVIGKKNVLCKISHVKSSDVAAPIPNPTAGDAAELVAPFQMQVKPIDISKIDFS